MNLIGQEDRSTGLNSAWALIDLLNAQNAGAPPETIRSLTADYERARRVEEGSGYSGSEALTELLIAQRRAAPSTVLQTYRVAFERVRPAGIPPIPTQTPAPPPTPPPAPPAQPDGRPPITSPDGGGPTATTGDLSDLPVALLLTSPLWATLGWLWWKRRR